MSPETEDDSSPTSREMDVKIGGVGTNLEQSHTMEHSKMGTNHPDYNSTTILFTEGISGVSGGIFNYANTYVGAGIIGIPLARE